MSPNSKIEETKVESKDNFKAENKNLERALTFKQMIRSYDDSKISYDSIKA